MFYVTRMEIQQIKGILQTIVDLIDNKLLCSESLLLLM